MEAATALASGVLVVPVLVERTHMPQPPRLPVELRRLPELHALHFELAGQAEATEALVTAVRRASLRRTPTFLGLCHLNLVVLLSVFFSAGGFALWEFTTALAIVAPAVAAVGAVAVYCRWSTAQRPARVSREPPWAMLIPLAFVSVIAALVVMKALNVGPLSSFETFKRALALVEVAFAAYTGLALARMLENRSEP
ncbi:MAG: hypothetical protein L0Z50_31245 [Verrucomicrobiales bacterium]|nr:hypothetical protein [Verrucomicrobiales bacterium]